MEKEYSEHERRRTRRIKSLYMMVAYVVEGRDTQTVELNCGKIIDINRFGMRVECLEPLNQNDLVKAQIHTMHKTISVKGKVVHTEESLPGLYVAGVEFAHSYPEFDSM